MGQNLKSFLAFDTEGFPADGVFRNATLINTWGVPVYIRQIQIWMGMDVGGKADYAVSLGRVSDNGVFAFTNWDHYADPTNLHDLIRNYEPNYMLLDMGDGMRLDYAAKAIPGTMTNGHVVVRAWWTEAP